MTRTTKLELEQQLVAQGRELEQLRAQLGDAKHDLRRITAERDAAVARADDMHAELVAPATKSVAPSVSPSRAAYLERRSQRVEGPTEYQLACRRAREHAMASGRAVRVAG
jgi:hypothetical protein